MQIAVEGVNHFCQVIRIENTLTDEKDTEVQLKEGAHVNVTVNAEPGAVNTKKPSAR